MLTKGAIGNLINRYKAVLKKCNLINTFGSLAVASMLVMGGAGVAGATSSILVKGGEYQNGGYTLISAMQSGNVDYDSTTFTATVSAENNLISSTNTSNYNVFASLASDADKTYSGPTVQFIGDENTDVHLASSSGYSIVSRHGAVLFGSEDKHLKSVVVEGVDGGTVIYATASNYNNHQHDLKQKCEFYADTVELKGVDNEKSESIIGNGGSVKIVADSVMNITGTISGYNSVYGGVDDMDYDLNFSSGSDAVATIKGDVLSGGTSVVKIGLRGEGSSLTGNVSSTGFGDNIKDGGLIELAFGDKGVLTGDVVSKDLGDVKIAFGKEGMLTGRIDVGVGSEVTLTGDATDKLTIAGQTVANYGGAIYNKGTVELDGVSFNGNGIDNTGYAYGGAIYNEAGGIVDIKNSEFSENYTKSTYKPRSGAIRNNGIMTIADTVFTGNVTKNTNESTKTDAMGGAYHGAGDSTLEATNVKFIGNISSGEGGAIYLNKASVNFKGNNIFDGNTAGKNGGALEVQGGSTVNFDGVNEFTGNTAVGNGGAVSVTGANTTVNFSGTNSFSDNTAGGVANDIYNEGTINVIGGTTTLGSGLAGNGKVNVQNGTLKFLVDAGASDNTFTIGNGSADSTATLELTADSVFSKAIAGKGVATITDEPEALTVSGAKIALADGVKLAITDTSGAAVTGNLSIEGKGEVSLDGKGGVFGSVSNVDINVAKLILGKDKKAIEDGDVGNIYGIYQIAGMHELTADSITITGANGGAGIYVNAENDGIVSINGFKDGLLIQNIAKSDEGYAIINNGQGEKSEINIIGEGDIDLIGSKRSAIASLGYAGKTVIRTTGDVKVSAEISDENFKDNKRQGSVVYADDGAIEIAGKNITLTGPEGKRTIGLTGNATLTLDAEEKISITGSIADALDQDGNKVAQNSKINLAGGNLTLTGTVDGFTGTYAQKAGSTTLTEANGFFGGAVELTGGTMTAHTVDASKVTKFENATLNATNTLGLNGKDFTVGESATLIVGTKIDNAIGEDSAYQDGKITFGGNKLIVDGGTFIADADIVLKDDFSAQDGMAEGIVGKAGDVKLDLAVKDGNAYKAGEYTMTQFGVAREALFGEKLENGTFSFEKEAAQLSFLNAIRQVEDDANVLVGATSSDGKDADGKTIKIATIGYDDMPTEVTEGQALKDMPDDAGHREDFHNNKIKLTDHDDPTHGALDVHEIHAKGAHFDGGFLVVAERDKGDDKVKLVFGKEGDKVADVHLSGYHHPGDDPDGQEHHGIVSDEKGKELKVSFDVEEGAKFTFGHAANSKLAQTASIEEANIKDGHHIVDGGEHHDEDEHDGAYYTDITYDKVNVGEKGHFSILNASAKVNGLSGKGRVYIDPAYVQLNDTFSALENNVTVAKGSVVEVGSQVAALSGYVAEVFGADNMQEASLGGFTLKGERAVLSLLGHDGALKMAAGGALEVRGNVSDNTYVAAANTVKFGTGSLLVVEGSKAASDVAILGTADHSIAVTDDAKLYIANAVSGETYTIADSFGKGVTLEGWNDDNLIVNHLINAVAEKDAEGDGIIVTTSEADMSEALPGVIPTDALSQLLADGVKNDAPEAGKRFLSLATDPTVIADTGMAVDTINEVTRAAVTAGVQNTALRITDAASNTVLDHMSLAGHTASVHADGADFWAAPMYGNLYTSGMNVAGSSVRGQFGGLALGADLEGGNFLGGKFRIGAAINGGGGQSETSGTVTSTQNDYDFGGLNVYAGWNNGALNVIGSLGYGFGNHEVEMGIPVAGIGKAKADVDTTVFTADLRAEYQLTTAWVDVLPHVGVRYTALRTDDHELKVNGDVLNSVERATQNIVQFPIGVTLSKDFAFADWSVKPMVDVSVIPAAGDKKAETKVRFEGIDAWDSVNSRIMDSTSWAGTVGVQAEKGNLSLGLNYGVQASSNETDQNVQLKFGWKF